MWIALLPTFVKMMTYADNRSFLENKDLFKILETSYSGFWDWNIVENTEYLSAGFKAMFGYAENEMESSPEAWQAIAYHEDLPALFESFEKHVQSKGEIPFSHDVRFRHKNGHTIHVRCSGAVIEWSDEGAPLRAVGTHLDITDTVTKQREILSKDEEWLNIILKVLPEIVILADVESGTILFCNEEVEQVLGYTPEELIGKNNSILHPKKDLAKLATDFKELDSNEGSFLYFINKKGEKVPFVVRDKLIDFQGKQARLGVFTDQRTLQNAQIALKRKEEQFREVTEKSMDLITIVDKDFKFAYVTPNSYEIGGFEPSELIGKPFWDFLHPENKDDVVAQLQGFINDLSRDELNYEAKWIHKDPSKHVWLKIRLTRYKDIDEFGNEILREGLSYCKDITKEKIAEEERKKLDALKGEFVSIASHQLRTPLSVMKLNLDLLTMNPIAGGLQKLDANVKAQLNKRHEKLNNAVTRMTNLTSDLLIYGKVTEGQILPAKQKLKLSDIVLSAREANNQENLIQPRPEFNTCETYINTDPKLLLNVISNLLENAIKYSKGVTDKPVQIFCEHFDHHVVLHIQDFGIGIPKDEHEKVLNSFTRGSNAREFEGTGLGLAIVKSFCKLLDIQLSFKSQVNKGSTFSLLIPTINA